MKRLSTGATEEIDFWKSLSSAPLTVKKASAVSPAKVTLCRPREYLTLSSDEEKISTSHEVISNMTSNDNDDVSSFSVAEELKQLSGDDDEYSVELPGKEDITSGGGDASPLFEQSDDEDF